MSELRQILLSGAEQMDLSLKDRQTEQLLSYLQLMTKWNKTYNLSAIRDPQSGVKNT